MIVEAIKRYEARFSMKWHEILDEYDPECYDVRGRKQPTIRVKDSLSRRSHVYDVIRDSFNRKPHENTR